MSIFLVTVLGFQETYLFLSLNRNEHLTSSLSYLPKAMWGEGPQDGGDYKTRGQEKEGEKLGLESRSQAYREPATGTRSQRLSAGKEESCDSRGNERGTWVLPL